MASTKFSKQYDYYKRGEKMVSYSPDGGVKGDGVYDNVPTSHLEGATAAGAVEGGKAAAAPAGGTK